MDFILILLFVGIIASIYWLIIGVLRFFGILKKGESRGNLRKSFSSIELGFFENWPIAIFIFLVFAGVSMFPIFFALLFIKAKIDISFKTELAIYSFYYAIIGLVVLLLWLKGRKEN